VTAATEGVSAQRLAADAACTRCHDELEGKPILSIYQSKHGVTADSRTPTCQSCHGESKDHLAGNVDGKGFAPPDVVFGSKKTTAGYIPNEAESQAGACYSCHTAGLRTHWEGSQHQNADVVCSNCHVSHAARDPVLVKITQPAVCFACHQDQRAMTHQISTHPLDAGKMSCSSCHNPHGGNGPKLLKANTVTETCFTCHAEKRGPFLWEHQPVNEDCTICHTPHGSNLTPLLKSRAPFLCDECHDGPHNSRSPYGTGAAGLQGGLTFAGSDLNNNAVGRACMNCHVMVHGTNSPAGALLHR
jgi:DmsE family decaheme c-type cytochrome